MDILDSLINCVINGAGDEVSRNVLSGLQSGLPATQILNDGLIKAMDEVGRLYESGDLFVPEMLAAARAMKAGLSLLRPHLVASGVPNLGRVLIGTVKGDVHDIGKNLVGMMLEGAGFEIIDLGTDVPPERFAAAVRELNPDVVGLSALLTTTMYNMKSTIEALDDLGVRTSVKVIIGGAPVTPEFSVEIGADGYAPDATRAVDLVRSLLRC